MARRKVSRKKSARKKRKNRATSKFNYALRRLKTLKAPQQRQALSMANNAFLRHFVNHIKKLKRVKLPLRASKAFRKHRKTVRKLVNSRTSMSKRRTILSQKGKGSIFDFIKSIPIIGDGISLIQSL